MWGLRLRTARAITGQRYLVYLPTLAGVLTANQKLQLGEGGTGWERAVVLWLPVYQKCVHYRRVR